MKTPFIFFCLGLFLLTYYNNASGQSPTITSEVKPLSFYQDSSIHLSKIIPSKNLADTVLIHEYYVVAYSSKHKNPEWVIYNMTGNAADAHAAERSSNFKPDPKLPDRTDLSSDYVKTGYDKGHLLPAEDLNFSEQAMETSFFMSNISPQLPGFNRGIWKKLENNVRKWATENEKLIVITGPVLSKEFDSLTTFIGHNIEVPKQFFKIVLDYSEPEIKAIAFIMSNEKSTLPLSNFACTIKEVEELSGIDFFPTMRPEYSLIYENQSDIKAWKLE
jgi:endonuclease G